MADLVKVADNPERFFITLSHYMRVAGLDSTICASYAKHATQENIAQSLARVFTSRTERSPHEHHVHVVKQRKTLEEQPTKQGARNPRALFGVLAQVRPGELKPRGEEDRRTWPLHDSSNPSICGPLWRVFSHGNSKLNISEKQRDLLTSTVHVRGSDVEHPSPQSLYEQYPVVFEAFLEKLYTWMRSKAIPVNTGNIIKYVRGYDFRGIGWFAHAPETAIAFVEDKPQTGSAYSDLKEFLS